MAFTHIQNLMTQLAYNGFLKGLILITDMIKILDSHPKNGVHGSCDGMESDFVNEGFKLYFEDTDTLTGRCVSRISDVIRSSLFVDSTLSRWMHASAAFRVLLRGVRWVK